MGRNDYDATIMASIVAVPFSKKCKLEQPYDPVILFLGCSQKNSRQYFNDIFA